VEAESRSPVDAPQDTLPDTRRKKMPGQRNAALAHLPVERIVYDRPESEPGCDTGHGRRPLMSAEIPRELQVIPAQVTVIERVQPVDAGRPWEQQALTPPIQTAPLPRPVYPGSRASASLLAFTLHPQWTYVNKMDTRN
jgi:hypothetical protein